MFLYPSPWKDPLAAAVAVVGIFPSFLLVLRLFTLEMNDSRFRVASWARLLLSSNDPAVVPRCFAIPVFTEDDSRSSGNVSSCFIEGVVCGGSLDDDDDVADDRIFW